jgi:sialidase-1
MPFNEGPWGAWNVYAVYSDDGGETWQYGETAPEGPHGRPNEVQMVERADGSVLLNARNIGGAKCRKTAVSTDGGQTWTRLSDADVLIDPECQGTIIRYGTPRDTGEDVLLFANPASAEHRVNGTVRMSYDGGETWPVARTVYSGPFAYSCLTTLPDGTIGLLYERDGYERITFARFNLAWLMAEAGAP